MTELFKNSRIIKLPTIGSTNTYMSELSEPIAEGSVVWAMKQTSGRGQGVNKWESEPNKNLTFSIVLYPAFLPAYQQFYMSKVLALAVADLISLYTDNVSIKWPNDIFVGDSKIAGILIENSIERTYIKQTIGGIGININQENFFGLDTKPVSLYKLTGKTFNLDEILLLMIDLIAKRYLQLKIKEIETIDRNFDHMLYRYQQPSNFLTAGRIFEGFIQGVESTGELIIKDTSGKIYKFIHKEVEIIK